MAKEYKTNHVDKNVSFTLEKIEDTNRKKKKLLIADNYTVFALWYILSSFYILFIIRINLIGMFRCDSHFTDNGSEAQRG